jgi:alcohol dehydrogenase (cytochrome c)
MPERRSVGVSAERDAKDGKPLWHTRVGNISNAPQTYSVDGKQYLLVATGDMLWAFNVY